MTVLEQSFQPEPSRIFLDRALAQGLALLPVRDGRCLNVGCGTVGRYSELLVNFEVDGVDIADPQGKPMPWRYHRCDASRLPFPDATFDLAVAIESFEHIEKNDEAMRELVRALKPEGWLIVTTPTHWTWLFEFGRHGPHYYRQRELECLIMAAGLTVSRRSACGGVLFWLANLVKSWLSPVGVRLLGKRWWKAIDSTLLHVYRLSLLFDRILPFPPTNWLMIARKPGV